MIRSWGVVSAGSAGGVVSVCCWGSAKQIVVAVVEPTKRSALKTKLRHPRVISKSLSLVVRSNEDGAGDGRGHLRGQKYGLPLDTSADCSFRNDHRISGA